MWRQERAVEVVDSILEIPALASDPFRYIKIGLLCVQENAGDRPLMSDIASMLTNQQMAVDSPRNPAFTVGRSLAEVGPKRNREGICSANSLTVTNMEGR